ncbi:MAG: DUF4412 domain-containing protein [Candidatus Acidiferrales bacterium]
MRVHRGVTCWCVLAVCLAGGVARAGVVVETEQREPGSTTAAGRALYSIDAGRLRIEARSSEGEETLVIFRADKSVAWIINQQDRTYYEITPAKVAQMKQQMEAAQRQMAAELEKMPPDQRKMVEEMMTRMGQRPGSNPPPYIVRAAGRGEKVGSFVCTRYEILRGSERTGELWAASVEQLKLGPEDFKTFSDLAKLFEPLGQQGPMGQLAGLKPLGSGGETIEGYPVRTLTYDGGRLVQEEVVVRAEQQTFDNKLFELPSGLRKTELNMQAPDEP